MDQHEAREAIAQMPKPIKWVIPDSIRTDHATHLVVQQQGSEFMLLFFEVQAPVFSGTPEEQLAAFKELPLISIVEPYIDRETDRDLYAHLPPKSTRDVILNITREGKAKPKASLD